MDKPEAPERSTLAETFERLWSQALLAVSTAEEEASRAVQRVTAAAGWSQEEVKRHAREFTERLLGHRRDLEHNVEARRRAAPPLGRSSPVARSCRSSMRGWTSSPSASRPWRRAMMGPSHGGRGRRCFRGSHALSSGCAKLPLLAALASSCPRVIPVLGQLGPHPGGAGGGHRGGLSAHDAA